MEPRQALRDTDVRFLDEIVCVIYSCDFGYILCVRRLLKSMSTCEQMRAGKCAERTCDFWVLCAQHAGSLAGSFAWFVFVSFA